MGQVGDTDVRRARFASHMDNGTQHGRQTGFFSQFAQHGRGGSFITFEPAPGQTPGHGRVKDVIQKQNTAAVVQNNRRYTDTVPDSYQVDTQGQQMVT
jgi:hypothetical protein